MQSKISIRENNIQVKGKLSLYDCKAVYDKDNNYQIIEKSEKPLLEGDNIICQGFFNFIPILDTAAAVIAIGNGDNGTINPSNHLSINPSNAPNYNDIQLNKELENGRFPSTNLEERKSVVNETMTFSFQALMPANAYSQQISEWGLFVGRSGIVELVTKDSGFLIARRAEPFTKQPDQDVLIVWVVSLTIN